MKDQWFPKVFAANEYDFEDLSLEVFHFQYLENPVYQEYVDRIGLEPGSVDSISKIPFLPVSFFKTHEVKTTRFEPQLIFESSGTTDSPVSRHFIRDEHYYRSSFITNFERCYGPVTDWCILGLLPSYLERKNSSLAFMVEDLIRKSQHSHSAFYLYDYHKLSTVLTELEIQKQKSLLIGVSFALLDFAENYTFTLESTTVMETGGMKGRRKELIRSELHDLLKKKFGVNHIHSEYGMTELLSQAYSFEGGLFRCPPGCKSSFGTKKTHLKLLTAPPGLNRPSTL